MSDNFNAQVTKNHQYEKNLLHCLTTNQQTLRDWKWNSIIPCFAFEAWHFYGHRRKIFLKEEFIYSCVEIIYCIFFNFHFCFSSRNTSVPRKVTDSLVIECSLWRHFNDFCIQSFALQFLQSMTKQVFLSTQRLVFLFIFQQRFSFHFISQKRKKKHIKEIKDIFDYCYKTYLTKNK